MYEGVFNVKDVSKNLCSLVKGTDGQGFGSALILTGFGSNLSGQTVSGSMIFADPES